MSSSLLSFVRSLSRCDRKNSQLGFLLAPLCFHSVPASLLFPFPLASEPEPAYCIYLHRPGWLTFDLKLLAPNSIPFRLCSCQSARYSLLYACVYSCVCVCVCGGARVCSWNCRSLYICRCIYVLLPFVPSK